MSLQLTTIEIKTAPKVKLRDEKNKGKILSLPCEAMPSNRQRTAKQTAALPSVLQRSSLVISHVYIY
jgi:hypothetical protein